MSPTARLPLNTDGGGLCNNHPANRGGMTKVIEAVRQLRGEAHPEVQVPDCKLPSRTAPAGGSATRMGGATLMLGRRTHEHAEPHLPTPAAAARAGDGAVLGGERGPAVLPRCDDCGGHLVPAGVLPGLRQRRSVSWVDARAGEVYSFTSSAAARAVRERRPT